MPTASKPPRTQSLIDASDDQHPRIIATAPVPRPSPGLPYRNYYEKGGRFGPHNQHHHQGHPDLFPLQDRLCQGCAAYGHPPSGGP